MSDETAVIVNDRGGFFMWVHGHWDEFDNLTGRGISWTTDWQYAHVFDSRRSAEKKLVVVRSFSSEKVAVVY